MTSKLAEAINKAELILRRLEEFSQDSLGYNAEKAAD
jgi:hypothetical protein